MAAEKQKFARGWFKFPRCLAQCGILTPSEKAVLLAVLSRCNPIRDQEFRTWVGNDRLREDTGLSPRQIRYVLAKLAARGAIVVESDPRSRMIKVNEKWDGIRSEDCEDFRERCKG